MFLSKHHPLLTTLFQYLSSRRSQFFTECTLGKAPTLIKFKAVLLLLPSLENCLPNNNTCISFSKTLFQYTYPSPIHKNQKTSSIFYHSIPILFNPFI